MPRKTIASLEVQLDSWRTAYYDKVRELELCKTKLEAANISLDIIQRFNSTATIAMERICDATAHALGDVARIDRERRIRDAEKTRA